MSAQSQLIATVASRHKLTEQEKTEIRQKYALGTVTQGTLAKQYEVSQGTISNVLAETRPTTALAVAPTVESGPRPTATKVQKLHKSASSKTPVAPELLDQLEQKFVTLPKSIAEYKLLAGEILYSIRKYVSHGDWEPKLLNLCMRAEISRRTGYNYLCAYQKNIGEKPAAEPKPKPELHVDAVTQEMTPRFEKIFGNKQASVQTSVRHKLGPSGGFGTRYGTYKLTVLMNKDALNAVVEALEKYLKKELV